MGKFLLKCDCGEEVELEGYNYSGNISDYLSIEIEVDEVDHTEINVNFKCATCGNHFYIANF